MCVCVCVWGGGGGGGDIVQSQLSPIHHIGKLSTCSLLLINIISTYTSGTQFMKSWCSYLVQPFGW